MTLRKQMLVTLATLMVLAAPGVIMHARQEKPQDPDRVLYERSLNDLKMDRYTAGRLGLQTLINTYSDSEYVQRAKFALAESFYKEGTPSGYSMAETEFKDYLTFFPTSSEADAAQYFVAMTQLKLAEIELNKFIDNYPNSPKAPEVRERLIRLKSLLPPGQRD